MSNSRFYMENNIKNQSNNKKSSALEGIAIPLEKTPLRWRHPKVRKKDLQTNGLLLNDTQIKKVKKWFDGHLNERRLAQKISCLPYTIIRGGDENPNRYFAIYKGKKHDKHLGKGAFGVVKLMQDLDTGEWFVIKIQNIDDQSKKQSMEELARKESDHLASLNRRVIDFSREKQGHKERTQQEMQYVVGMTLAPGIPLSSLIGNREITSVEWLKIITNMIQAVKNIYDEGWLHRDIKPDNMMYDPISGKITIIDFGFATCEKSINDRTTRKCGTPYFMAPEIAQGVYNEKTEVYALGASIIDLLKKYHLERLPRSASRCIKRMVSPNPDRRPSLSKSLRFFNQEKEKYLDILSKIKIVGLLNVEEYQKSHNKTKRQWVTALKATDEVMLTSTSLNPDKQQCTRLMESLGEKGIYVHPMVWHHADPEKKSAHEQIMSIPDYFKSEQGSQHYHYVTANNHGAANNGNPTHENTLLPTKNITYIYPSPHHTVDDYRYQYHRSITDDTKIFVNYHLKKEMLRLHRKYILSKSDTKLSYKQAKKRIDMIENFINNLPFIRIDTLMKRLKKLEEETQTLSPSKTAHLVKSVFGPAVSNRLFSRSANKRASKIKRIREQIELPRTKQMGRHH